MLHHRAFAFASAFAFVVAVGSFAGSAEAQTIPASGQIKSPHSGLCVEIPGGSTAPGATAAQATCSTAAQQNWDFRPAAAGGHQIVSKASNLCLAVRGASVVQGTAIEQQACTGDAGQRWNITASGSAVELRNANSGQCVEIGNGSTSPGATLNQWNCVDAGQQKWTLVPAGPTTPPVPASAMIVNMRSGMCLDMPGASKSTGTQADQWTCVDVVHLDWIFRASPAGGYQLVNRNSNLCLDVNAGSTADGAVVLQWTCGSQANQRWTPRFAGSGVELVAAHSGKCLTVVGGSLDNGGKAEQRACQGVDNQRWTFSVSAGQSKWSAKYRLPIVPVAASTLRNGKVLTWSAYDRFSFGGDQGKTFTTIFDPATGTSTEKLVSNTGHDMFCPGTATLPDGRILVNGGSSSAKTSIYDPNTNAWTSAPAMNVPRGYQGDTVLSTGEVLTVGGSWSGGSGGKIGEVWKSGSAWRRLTNVPTGPLEANPDPQGVYRTDNHMWLFGSANGYAFHAGPSKNMNWISTSGSGSITSAGPRGDDVNSMNGNMVMYDAGKLLKMGGAGAYQNALATSSAYAIDFSGGPGQPVAVAKQKPMSFPRVFANTVVLPTGDVVALGGQSWAVPFSDDRSIMMPEIWSPATGEFRRLKQMTTPRTYHSVATLLRDGRVLVGGGGLCGSCATNHPDVEILTPPYLLNADGSNASRPVITGAPSSAARGSQIAVSTDRAVTSFAIVRLSAVTHSVNNDQRRIALPIASASGGTYRMTLPDDPGLLLGGDWMLFAMDAKGVPSVANIVRVQ